MDQCCLENQENPPGAHMSQFLASVMRKMGARWENRMGTRPLPAARLEPGRKVRTTGRASHCGKAGLSGARLAERRDSSFQALDGDAECLGSRFDVGARRFQGGVDFLASEIRGLSDIRARFQAAIEADA